jgi:colicin import membrane protein
MIQAVLAHEFAPPTKHSDKRAFVFSLGVHLLLVAALTWGVSWSTRDNSVAVEAELWQATPVLAAPKLVEPEPAPAPVDTPKQAKTPESKPVDNSQTIREAQLATARLKKLEQEKLEQDRQARILQENERLKKEKLLKEKAEKEKAEKEKAEKEKLAKEKLEKEKKTKEKADQQKTDKDAARAKEIEGKKLDAMRQDQLKRMAGMAGANGSADSTGTALRSGGPSAGYAGRIKGRVKPNIIYPDISPSENPMAEVSVRVSPDGTILSRHLTKPSGNASWDAAVLKAIDKTEKFPRDIDGTVPNEIIITFKPNE